MKNTSKKLELGRELSKNTQKQILGGVTLVCTGGTFILGPTCDGQAAYCAATGRGSYVTCY